MNYPANWRNAGLNPVVFGMDSRATIGWVLFLLHMSQVTFFIAAAFTLVFGISSRMGYTPAVAWGRLLDFIVGGKHYTKPRLRSYQEDSL